jgi:hypothetical protein
MGVLGTHMIKMGIGRVTGVRRGMKRKAGLVELVLSCRVVRVYDWD